MRLFVSMLEKLLGRTAQVELLPAQPGDLPETCASIDRVKAAVGYEPRTSLDDGLKNFVEWFKSYYRV